MTLHVPMVEAKSTCTPSSRLAIGGISPSRIAALAAYLSPHSGAPLVTPGLRRWIQSTRTLDAPYPYRAASSEDGVGRDNWAIDPGLVKQLKQLLHLHHLSASQSHRPALLLLRNLADVTCRKWFLLVLHVEPFAVPIPH
jgi:hypothetical protein